MIELCHDGSSPRGTDDQVGVISIFSKLFALIQRLWRPEGPFIKYVTLKGRGVREGVTICDRGGAVFELSKWRWGVEIFCRWGGREKR